jgi:hypothetical protein
MTGPLKYRGQPNRRARKISNLRVSQWRREHGIHAWQRLEPMQMLRALYSGPFVKTRTRSPLHALIKKAAI